MILPSNYNLGDTKWISEQLSIIETLTGVKNAHSVAISYSMVYAETYDLEQEGHKKENKARFEANSRLRKMVKRLQEKPIKPTA